MTSLATEVEAMSDAKRQLLEKRLRGKIIEQGSAPRVFKLVENPVDKYLAYPLRKYQQALLKKIRLSDQAAWFYLETESKNIDAIGFAEIFSDLVNFHPILNTRLQSNSGGDRLIAERGWLWAPEIKDLRESSPELADSIQSELRETFRQKNLAGNSAQPIRLAICLLGDNTIRIHLGVDMLLLDLVSIEFLALQCRQIYEQRKLLGKIAPLSFRDYSITESEFLASSFEADKSRRYWELKQPGLHPMVTLKDFAQPNEKNDRDNFGYSLSVLPKSLWLKLKQYASQKKLTGSMIVYSMFSLLIAKWTGRDRFSLEMRLFRRFPFHLNVNDIMGQFSSGIVSSLTLERNQSLHDYCAAVEDQTWRDLDHGYVDIISENIIRNDPAFMPPGIVFTSTISRYEEFVEEGSVPPMKWFGKTLSCTMQIPNQILELLIVENDGELECHWFFNGAYIAEDIINTMQVALAASLITAAQDPQAWLAVSVGDALTEILNS